MNSNLVQRNGRLGRRCARRGRNGAMIWSAMPRVPMPSIAATTWEICSLRALASVFCKARNSGDVSIGSVGCMSGLFRSQVASARSRSLRAARAPTHRIVPRVRIKFYRTAERGTFRLRRDPIQCFPGKARHQPRHLDQRSMPARRTFGALPEQVHRLPAVEQPLWSSHALGDRLGVLAKARSRPMGSATRQRSAAKAAPAADRVSSAAARIISARRWCRRPCRKAIG